MTIKDSKSKGHTIAKSWRQIKQSSGHKAVTNLARKRRLKRLLKVSALSLAGLSVVGGIGFGLYLFQTNGNKIIFSGLSKPIDKIVFETDGVLTADWCKGVIQLTGEESVMDVDIFAIKSMLEKQGQVKSATVTRQFPDKLRLVVREYQPVLRARISEKRGGLEEVLIARDGTVYRGRHYPEAALAHLPFFGGGRFRRGDEGITPVPGMAIVAQLLTLARVRSPHIYATWAIVSWENFDGEIKAPEAIITVQSRNIKEIVFAPANFEEQLAQLAQIIEHAHQHRISTIKRVDLSSGEQVVVRYFPNLPPRGLRMAEKFRN